MSILPFTFACPNCQTPLERNSDIEQWCPKDNLRFFREDGIWRFLSAEREAVYRQFIHEYTFIRHAEGRGSANANYYRALPLQETIGKQGSDWQIRAKSFDFFINRLLQPLEIQIHRTLTILDLGAGNCWLSNRLAQRGHQVAALDIVTDTRDGLGAYVHYDAPITAVQGEFDHLPFTDAQFDLAIFNASFHYSTDYAVTLPEALRLLETGGVLVILDTPIYHDPASGEQMVREREVYFECQYGFPSNALASKNYLTDQTLSDLANQLHITWTFYEPFYGLRWSFRPWKARLLGKREPARFMVITGKLTNN